MIQVTPNGPFGKERHPATPVRVGELLDDVRECMRAGVHLHVRDDDGAETLEPWFVNDVCRRVRALAREESLVEEFEIGLTTGAWIVPSVDERVAMIREWEGVDCATVNLSEPGFERVMTAMRDVHIGIDVGLWAPAEVPLLRASGWAEAAQRISIELGPGEPHLLTGDPVDVAARVNDALDAFCPHVPRLTHGMEAWTWPLVADALRRGHDTRVGFEDSVLLPDGVTAGSNAELVAAARRIARDLSPGQR